TVYRPRRGQWSVRDRAVPAQHVRAEGVPVHAAVIEPRAGRSGAGDRRRLLARQYDFREVRLTSGAQRGLASSRPEPHVLSGTNERGGQPWVSLARCSSSVSTSTRTPSPSPTRRRIAAPTSSRWGQSAPGSATSTN